METSLPFRIGRWSTLAVALVPVAIWPAFLFPYVTPRGVFFRVLVEVAVACAIWLALRRQAQWRFRGDYVLMALAAFVAASALAAASGVSVLRSLFGDYERMGGVWTWLHLLGFYFAARVFFSDRDWRRFLIAIVIVAAGVSLFGLLPPGVRRHLWGIGGPSQGITIGNGGLLAGYLLLAAGTTLLLAARAGGGRRLAWLVPAAVIVDVMLRTGNRSSVIGVGVGTLTTLAVTAWFALRRGKSRRPLVAAAIAAALLVGTYAFFLANPNPNTRRYAPSLFRIATEGVDQGRLIQWKAALGGFRDRPALGYGPENYHIVWSQQQRAEIYRYVPNQGWDRAHNAYLESLATTGIVGFLALLALISSTFVAVALARRHGGLTPGASAVLFGVFAAYGTYLVFWFFDLTAVTVWLALAGFAISVRRGPLAVFAAPAPRRVQTNVILASGAIAMAAVMYVYAYETLKVARALYRMSEPRSAKVVISEFEKIFESPAPSSVHAVFMYSRYLRGLMPQFAVMRADPAQAALMDKAFRRAVTAAGEEIAREPMNERLLVDRGRISLLASNYYHDARFSVFAVRDFARAVEIAPRRVHSRMMLGNALVTVGQVDRGIAELREAVRLFPDVAEARGHLAAAFLRRGEYDSAATSFIDALDRGWDVQPSAGIEIVRALRDAGRDSLAAATGLRYLQLRFGSLFLWRIRGVSEQPTAADAEIFDVTEAALGSIGSSQQEVLTSVRRAFCAAPTPFERLGIPGEAQRDRCEGTVVQKR